MALKRQNPNKLLKIVAIPAKFLSKTRDLYVRSMTSCAPRTNYGHSSPAKAHLPKSYSISSSVSGDTDDFRELIRAASVRSLGHRNEIEMLLHQAKAAKRLPKSCSVGMGRIDEETAEEDGSFGGGKKVGKTASSELYSRSKSCAVGKTAAAF